MAAREQGGDPQKLPMMDWEALILASLQGSPPFWPCPCTTFAKNKNEAMAHCYNILTHQSGLINHVKSQVGLLHEFCTVEQSGSQCIVLPHNHLPPGQVGSPPAFYMEASIYYNV